MAVVDGDLPHALSGAVVAGRRAYDLIVRQALPVAVLPAPVLVRHDAVTVREFPDGLLEEHQPIDEVRHELLLVRGPLFSLSVQAGPAVPGCRFRSLRCRHHIPAEVVAAAASQRPTRPARAYCAPGRLVLNTRKN